MSQQQEEFEFIELRKDFGPLDDALLDKWFVVEGPETEPSDMSSGAPTHEVGKTEIGPLSGSAEADEARNQSKENQNPISKSVKMCEAKAGGDTTFSNASESGVSKKNPKAKTNARKKDQKRRNWY